MKNGELTPVDTKTNKTETGVAGVENREVSLISPSDNEILEPDRRGDANDNLVFSSNNHAGEYTKLFEIEPKKNMQLLLLTVVVIITSFSFVFVIIPALINLNINSIYPHNTNDTFKKFIILCSSIIWLYGIPYFLPSLIRKKIILFDNKLSAVNLFNIKNLDILYKDIVIYELSDRVILYDKKCKVTNGKINYSNIFKSVLLSKKNSNLYDLNRVVMAIDTVKKHAEI